MPAAVDAAAAGGDSVMVALSQRGLAINDPNQRHTLSRYQGGTTVSALQAACIDLGREYALALGMAGEG